MDETQQSEVGSTPGPRVRRGPSGPVGVGPGWLGLLLVAMLVAMGLGVPAARGELQFDVFLGYDGLVPEASWFPVACEVFNDGAPFDAVFEISPGAFDQNQSQSMAVELPTGTRKRFVIPVFSSSRYSGEWNARLLNERGRVQAEVKGLRPRNQVSWEIPIMGAMASPLPALPEVKNKRNDLQPKVARLQPALFPDNPIALEGLRTLYLSSESALGNNLRTEQVKALLAWLYNGGHLIVGVEQIAHIKGTDWLKGILPSTLTDMTLLDKHSELQGWVQSDQRYDGSRYSFRRSMSQRGRSSTDEFPSPFITLKEDAGFEQQPMEVAVGRLRDGQVLVGTRAAPLVVSAPRGRGRITLLSFNPSLEPFKSWGNRAYFWAKMSDLPPELLVEQNVDTHGYYGVDGIFGVMIDSTQIRKLPVGWLLLLLLGYLAVIGPLDQFWLKKIGKQMLTWVTFPIYVALFSGLIYVIGYKLRAGETEWNELQIVDVLPLPVAGQADLRGRTFASIYSPVNADYVLASDQPVASLRGEFLGNRRQEGNRAEVEQRGNSFQARISVPVWTSQLYVSDWARQDAVPLSFSVRAQGSGYTVEVENRLEDKLSQVKLVVGHRVFDLGALGPEETKSFALDQDGQTLQEFVRSHGHMFVNAYNSRQRAFGENTHDMIPNVPASTMAVSFLGQLRRDQSYEKFIMLPGLDLSPVVDKGGAVLLAWAADHGAVLPMNRFSARRKQQATLYRVSAALSQP